MIDDRFTETPTGCAQVPDAVYEHAYQATDEHALQATWKALADERAVDRMASYYSRNEDSAGTADSHFALEPAASPTQAANANPWVTTSKLTARERADLFPVRDSVVSKVLGLSGRKQNFEVDWQVHRSLLQDEGIRSRLDLVLDDAADRDGVDIGSPMPRLRHLDVVLWMHARRGAEPGPRESE